MKHFLKGNKKLLGFFCIAILIIVVYMITLDRREWFIHAGDWFNLLFQLAVGFTINFVFFITQVYLPQYKYTIQARKCILDRVTSIVSEMKEIYEKLGIATSPDSYPEEFFVNELRNVNVDGRVGVINVTRAYSPHYTEDSHYTVKEWIITRIMAVENDIDKLLMYYTPYMTPELIGLLERILKSSMHRNMARCLLQLPNGISFRECRNDIFFKPYYDMMKELEKEEKNI